MIFLVSRSILIGDIVLEPYLTLYFSSLSVNILAKLMNLSRTRLRLKLKERLKSRKRRTWLHNRYKNFQSRNDNSFFLKVILYPCWFNDLLTDSNAFYCRTCMLSCYLSPCLHPPCQAWGDQLWEEVLLHHPWEEWECLQCHLSACHQWAAIKS